MAFIKFAHILLVPFTGVGLNGGYRGDEWFSYRISVFKNHTLKSLANQTAKGFVLWCTFRPQEKSNPLVVELSKAINEAGIAHIFTFHGLPYHDDKFDKGLKCRLMNTARYLRQCYRERKLPNPATCLESFRNKNKDLLNRLEKSIYELRALPMVMDASYVVLTRLDSDDMLHKDALDEIQRLDPEEGALVYKNGYIYNSITKELAHWNPATNPPFHTLTMLASTFFNPVLHYRAYRGYKSHEDIRTLFPEARVLPDNRYCVVVHGKHISTGWDHHFKGEPVDNKEEVLASFGL